MTDYPIETALHFAKSLGFPVLTADVPAISAAVHRHYALGQRDAAPRITGAVAAERNACLSICRQTATPDATRYGDGYNQAAIDIEAAIRARGAP